jgi:hypothetical protein
MGTMLETITKEKENTRHATEAYPITHVTLFQTWN